MTTHQPAVRQSHARGPSAWLLAAAIVLVGAGLIVLANAVRHEAPLHSSTRGSGNAVTDRREVAPFTTLELAGANTVAIRVGGPQTVAVTGDDNLVGRVTTVVRDGRLLIDDTGSFATKASMHVAVSVPSLDAVTLSGDGTVTVEGVATSHFSADLAGTGTVMVAGTAERITAVLAGDGTLDLHALAATDGTAQLRGTGTIRVYASSTLNATLSGTGTILYGGDPTVTTHNTGTGTVTRG